MSTISNAHSVQSLDTFKALSSQRGIRLTWKTDKNTGDKRESVGISVPAIDKQEIIDSVYALLPAIMGMLETSQNAIARKLVEAGKTEISSEEISIASCITHMEEEAKGNRITSDSLKEWFTSAIADSLTVALADKLGISDSPTQEEAKRIELTVNAYRDKIASMASGKTLFSPEIVAKLIPVLELAPEDIMAERFIARLEKMKFAQDDILLGL